MMDGSGEVLIVKAGLKFSAGSLLTLAASAEGLDPDTQVSI
jgi:hypothetical protein